MASYARAIYLAVYFLGVLSAEQPAEAPQPPAAPERAARPTAAAPPRAPRSAAEYLIYRLSSGVKGDAEAEDVQEALGPLGSLEPLGPLGVLGSRGALRALPLALVLPLAAINGEGREAAPRPPPAVRHFAAAAPRYAAAAPDAPAPDSATQPAAPDLFASQVPSSELVSLLRAQRAARRDLPPVVVRASGRPAPPPPPPPPPAPCSAPDVLVSRLPGPPAPRRVRQIDSQAKIFVNDAVSPAIPRFRRSLSLRGRLTVPRAGFTEFYNASWHAGSGSMRVDFYDGATSVFRVVNGSKIHRLERRLERAGDAPLLRCAAMTQDAAAASPLDLAPPAIPELSRFAFAGYVQLAGARAERWTRTVTGGAGELGGARGEALVHRHEMLLSRADDDFITPLSYSVSVDSSVLGPDCDGYVHRYEEVRAQEPAPALLRAERGACDALESTADLARVDPLREFALPARDPRHDDFFASYVTQFKRQYRDETEEAVRKNVLVQMDRFASAGNRVGATFRMGATALADRLEDELRRLGGVPGARKRRPAEPFPYSRVRTRALHAALPDHFDWRARGGVTPVRYQGPCSSCWAFAVAGAVEGALFRQTGRLVPLSEQALVDCAHPFGGGGCNATWPDSALDYVRVRGLPAQDLYQPYEAKVLECQDERVPPATFISGHVNVTAHSLSALKVAIARHAPTIVIIDIAPPSFRLYKSGVYYDRRCNKGPQRIKHAVLAVGWGGPGSIAGNYLVLKNSHSPLWGEEGFMRMAPLPNTCGVLDRPAYPRLEGDDPHAHAQPRA